MARVFRVGDRWWLDFRANGRRYRESAGPGATHALAKEILSKRMAEFAERRNFPARVANERPFDFVADEFKRLHVATLRSRTWGYALEAIRERFKGRKVGEITSADIQRFYNEIQARASASTANRYLTLLCSLFNKAKAWGHFYGDNPCSMVKKQREPNHRLRFLSKEEIKALYENAEPRLRPFLVAALHTGMRKGELLGLRWENVSLDRATIYILEAKSGKPREIPITGQLSKTLESLGPKPEGPVLDLPEIMARRLFEKARKAAKLPAEGPDKVTIHTLRHTFASHFIMQTHDLPTLQRLLGHCTPTLTQRYAHLSKGHLASEMALFEAGLALKQPTPAPAACESRQAVSA